MGTPKKINWELGVSESKHVLRLQYTDAEDILRDWLGWFFNENFQWFDWYKILCDWMKDNKGKGLLLSGKHYTGKSTISNCFIPRLLSVTRELIIHTTNAEELNNPKLTRAEDMFMIRFMKIIDNVGAESKLNEYGIRYEPFKKVVDDCFINNKFLIINTNYSLEQLAERYGVVTIKNLWSICRFIDCNTNED